MSCPLATERVWVDKSKYHDAEKDYFEHLSKLLKGGNTTSATSKESMVNAIDVSSPSNSAIITESKVTTTTATTTTGTTNNNKVKKNKKLKAAMAHAGEIAAAVGSPVISESNSTAVTAAMMMMTTTTTAAEEKSRHHSHSEASVASSHDHGKRNESGTRKDNNSNKNEEVKAKKKKKKKNNKETSIEKATQEVASGAGGSSIKNEASLIDEQLDKDKEDSLKRQKSTAKIKAPSTNQCALVSEIAKARQHIKNSLERMDGIAALAASPITAGSDVLDRLATLEKENASLRELVESLKKCCLDTQKRVQTLEGRLQQSQHQKAPTAAPQQKPPAPAANSADDDDGVDLFGSDSEEDEEANAIREQRLADYNAKKAKKPALIAKSSVVLDIKPWDDETDLGKMEQEIRKIALDGLLWGASKLQPVAFGIKKLVLSCVVEDEKVSIDWLTEEIEKLDDYVQSVDVAAFNKI